MDTTPASPMLYMGDRVAWDAKGNLIITADELLAKVDRPYLSPSTAKSMHSCPARMVSDRSMPSGFDLFGPTEKGSAAHTVLERLYSMAPGRRDAQHAMAILTEMSKEEPQGDGDVDYAAAIGQDPVRYNQWIAAIAASYGGLFAIEDPAEIDVHSNELRLDGVEVAGVPFKGFIDRIDHLKDGGLGVVDYKGLALDTPIPTPTGWTTMGDLKVGDQVLGTAGVPVNVTIKSGVHDRPCYRLTFSDASSVVCDNVHLWSITEAGTTTVLSADEVFDRFTAAPAGALSIMNAKPLDLPHAELPVSLDLGACLLNGGGAVPVRHRRASFHQRLTLLSELHSARTTTAPRGRAAIAAATSRAVNSIAELVATLGANPSIDGLTVSFDATLLETTDGLESAPVTSRAIAAMVRTDSVPTQCIQVDAPDSLYLCGPLMVPTHNTGKAKDKVNPFFDDDHGDQIRLYVEAMRVLTGEKPRSGRLLYISHGKQRKVALSKEADINKTKRAFAASWDDLRAAVDTQTFVAKASPLCGWCPLVNSCPTGINAGKVDRKGGAPSAVDLGIPTLRVDGTVKPVVGHTPKWAAAVPDEFASLLAVPEVPTAAHLSVGEEPPRDTDEGATNMSTGRPWKEAKPWEGATIDGHLSLNAYASTAVFGLSTLAAEELFKNGQKVGPAPVKALTALLAQTVLNAQAAVTNGSDDLQDGAHTRLRGVLRTSLDIIPLPFGGDEDAWALWVKRTHGFMVAIAATALDLFNNGPVVDLAGLVEVITPATPVLASPAALPAAA